MRRSILILLALWLSPLDARAEAPATVSAIQGPLLTLKTKLSAGVGDGICVYRGGKAVACGYLSESFKGGFRLRLTHGTNQFSANDSVQLMHQARFARRDAEEIVETPGTPGPASPSKWLLSAGGSLIGPTNYYFAPFLALEYKVAPKTTLGVQGSYFTSSGETGSLTAPGLFFSGQYYAPVGRFRSGPFTGFFGSFGLGCYLVSAKLTGGNTVSATSFFTRLVGGFRWPFTSRLVLTPKGGLQLVTKTVQGTVELGLPKFAMVGELELSIQF